MNTDREFLDGMAGAIRNPWPLCPEHRKAAIARLANIAVTAPPAKSIRAVSLLLAADRFNWEMLVMAARLDGRKTESQS